MKYSMDVDAWMWLNCWDRKVMKVKFVMFFLEPIQLIFLDLCLDTTFNTAINEASTFGTQGFSRWDCSQSNFKKKVNTSHKISRRLFR